MARFPRQSADGPSAMSPRRFGRTYTLPQWLAAIGALIPRSGSIWAVWGRHRITPAFREAIMLAVARSNGCPYCSYHHQEWAIKEGASDDEIANLEDIDPGSFDRAKWSAFVYARSLAENDFGPIPTAIAGDAQKHYSPSQLRDIETVARFMTFANRSANTTDALFFRRRGVPVSDSLPAEIVIAAAVFILSPLIVVGLCVTLRKSPLQFLREIRDIHRRHAIDLGLTTSAHLKGEQQ